MRGFVVIFLLLAAACALAPEAAQLHLRDREDVAGMRRHGWELLAEATRADRDGAPAFAAWHDLGETFHVAPRGAFRRIDDFVSGRPVLLASGAPMLSQVLFNPASARHIAARGLFHRATLDRLNAGFRADAPLAGRQIAPFPRDAMALKLVWTVVHARGLTPISVWDGEGAGAPSAWPRRVMVGAGGTPLDRFYHVAIPVDQLAAVRAIDPSAHAGDQLVLLAIHLTSKQIPDWIWATFWWHGRADTGPFAADRPAALAGPWRNYLMDVAYSADTPREADGAPNAAFNPYVESFAGGGMSNCMACHQGAVWTAAGAAPFLPPTRGSRTAGDPRFRAATRLDFMWSIARETH